MLPPRLCASSSSLCFLLVSVLPPRLCASVFISERVVTLLDVSNLFLSERFDLSLGRV